MLNSLQEDILEATLEFMITPIVAALETPDAINALIAVCREPNGPTPIAILCNTNMKFEIFDCFFQLRDIFKHSYPENRNVSYPYVGQEKGFCMYRTDKTSIREIKSNGDILLLNGRIIPAKNVVRNDPNDKYFIAKEEEGLLGLTAQEDDTTAPATKEDVESYIFQMLEKKLNEQRLIVGGQQTKPKVSEEVIERKPTRLEFFIIHSRLLQYYILETDTSRECIEMQKTVVKATFASSKYLSEERCLALYKSILTDEICDFAKSLLKNDNVSNDEIIKIVQKKLGEPKLTNTTNAAIMRFVSDVLRSNPEITANAGSESIQSEASETSAPNNAPNAVLFQNSSARTSSRVDASVTARSSSTSRF